MNDIPQTFHDCVRIANDIIAVQNAILGVEFIEPSIVPKPKTGKKGSLLEVLEGCLTKFTIKEVSDKLNLCVGTVRRWQELNDVPAQYTFDLFKIAGRPIVYTEYSSSMKDQFFTPNTIANQCWGTFKARVPGWSEYTFVEPSAGDGSFLKVLPKGSIGIDIEPRSDGILKADYLTWLPTDLTKKYIVFGNPPFGLRGHWALNFINHSFTFADYVCFILPQLFESDGKGSPRKRVQGYNLVHSESLTAMFYTPEKTEVKINGVFQIWSKHVKDSKYVLTKPSEELLKVYSLSDGGTVATTRNKKMLAACDIYLPSTCFGKDTMRLYERFEDLPGRKGYGVVFVKEKAAMVAKARRVDWGTVSFQSTNSAYNLRTSMIFDALTP